MAFGRGLSKCGWMTRLGMWQDSKTETYHYSPVSTALQDTVTQGHTRQVSLEYQQHIWITFLLTKFLRFRLLRHFYFSNSWVHLTFWCLSWPPEFKTQDCLQSHLGSHSEQTVLGRWIPRTPQNQLPWVFSKLLKEPRQREITKWKQVYNEQAVFFLKWSQLDFLVVF